MHAQTWKVFVCLATFVTVLENANAGWIPCPPGSSVQSSKLVHGDYSSLSAPIHINLPPVTLSDVLPAIRYSSEPRYQVASPPIDITPYLGLEYLQPYIQAHGGLHPGTAIDPTLTQVIGYIPRHKTKAPAKPQSKGKGKKCDCDEESNVKETPIKQDEKPVDTANVEDEKPVNRDTGKAREDDKSRVDAENSEQNNDEAKKDNEDNRNDENNSENDKEEGDEDRESDEDVKRTSVNQGKTSITRVKRKPESRSATAWKFTSYTSKNKAVV